MQLSKTVVESLPTIQLVYTRPVVDESIESVNQNPVTQVVPEVLPVQNPAGDGFIGKPPTIQFE